MEPIHPRTGKELTALERTLWRFRMVAHEGQTMWRGFNAYPDAAKAINEDLLFGLTNQALVIVTKFLEVWDDLGSLAKDEPRVIPTRKAIQPAVDRIRVWKGLDTFRNTTLAHPYLTKDKKLLPPWELVRAGLAPTYHAEIILLLQCVVMAVAGILSAFEDVYTPIDPLAGPPMGEPLRPEPGIAHGAEIKPAIREVAGKLDEGLKRELGIVVKGPLAEAFRKAITA